MKTQPWHSTVANDPIVYHDEDDCVDGNRIDPKKRQPGTDDRPRCNECIRLEREARDTRGRKAFEEQYHRTAE